MDIDTNLVDKVELYLVRLTRERLHESPDFVVGPRQVNVYVQGEIDVSEAIEHWDKLQNCTPTAKPLVHRHTPCVLLVFRSNGKQCGLATIDWGFGSIVTDIDRHFGVRDFDALCKDALEARIALESALRSGKEVSKPVAG
ncbi:MAG: hypothetical protein MI861_08555 [Pirellulales bacterium]|nr:hypothetical protein [Pirellulales bacterium]